MEAVVLQDIPWRVDRAALFEQLHVQDQGRHANALSRLATAAEARGKPKALYKACLIEARGEDSIVLEGVTLRSRVLAVNLQRVHRAFPFVATCGTEIEAWAASFSSSLERLWVDALKGMALSASMVALLQHMDEHHRPGRLSMMNPGSLEDWPISEQRALFRLLGDPETSIGVELLPSGFMRPSQSVSGIWFPVEEQFENCMLCPMERCPARRAPYDSDLYRRKYARR